MLWFLVKLIDIVNENDEVVRISTKEEAHAKGLPHRGVHVIIVCPSKEILLQKRGKGKYIGLPDCSVSEHLKTGETYDQGAVRGAKEEFGLSLNPAGLNPIIKFKMEYAENDVMFSIMYFYYFKERPNVKVDKEEVEETVYFTREGLLRVILNFPEKLCPWVQEIFNFLLKKTLR